MTSGYNIKDFKNKLEELTKNGYPLIKGNPFAVFSINFSSKPFYGNIYNSEFKITKNANINLVPYTITGSYKRKGNLTEINYEIIPMKFGYYWLRIFPILLNIILLMAVFFNFGNFKINFSQTKTYILIVIFELFAFLPMFLDLRKKKLFENNFIKEMKINNYAK